MDIKYGFPRISSVSQALHGMDIDYLLNAFIMSMNGELLYQKDIADIRMMLQGEQSTIVDVVLLSTDGQLYYGGFTLLPSSQNPGWKKADKNLPPVSLLPVKRGDKWGFIDVTGKEVIPFVFDQIRDRKTPFKNGIEAVKQRDKWGYINLAGEWVLPPEWSSAKNFRGELAAVNDKVSFLTVEWGFIDRQGSTVIRPRKLPFAAFFSDGLCQVLENDLTGFMNTKGEIVISCKYYDAKEFTEGLASVQLEKNGKYGYIDRTGKTILPYHYSSAYPFYDGRALVSTDDGSFIIDKQGDIKATFEETPAHTFFAKQRVVNDRIRASRDGKYGFMDGSGKLVIPIQYVDAKSFFGDGLIGVTLTGIKGKGNEKEGGWFFIDKDGNTVIKETFEQISRFSEGRCWVKRNGKWGLIDTDGKLLTYLKYNIMPTPFRNGVSRVTLEVDSGGLLPEIFYAYVSRDGLIIWEP